MKNNFVFVTMLLGVVACSNSATPTLEETREVATPTKHERQATPTKILVTLTASPTPTVTPTIPQTPLPLQIESDPFMAGLIYSWDYDYWLIDSRGDHSLVDTTRTNSSPSGQYTVTTDCGMDCTDIFLTDLATGEQTNLTNTEQASSSPLWSQDSKKIYYLEWDEHISDIWSVDITTLEKTRLTQTPDRVEVWPFRLSGYPDLLFFYSWTSDISPGEGWVGYLSSVKLDGSEYVALPHDLTRYPAFSPDGKTIGLMTYGYDEEDNFFRETLLYHPGSEPQPFPLEKYMFDELTDVKIASPLSWSPNQTKIAIWAAAQLEGDDFFGIVLLDLLNFTTKVIGEYKAPYTGWSTPYKVEWSKDSQWITFYASDSGEDEDYGIWLADENGRDVQKLNNFGENFDYCDHVWSPDGRWFIYSCGYLDETFGSWLVDLNTTNQSPADLPSGARVAGWPTFVLFEVNAYLQIMEAGANLNLREAPDLNAPVLLQLQSGDIIQILEGPIETENFIWWKVRTEGNVEGWVVEQWGWYASVDRP
ncbi:MAG: hypothetical protein DWQ07_20385 [Chloroflexi bacterium]|nr:MAG: hypothetical protein DWQ07_20385 [Chloroflexota bacterium]MBL1194441.1 hypothetical protein [Chloroflexota bacterium]NOH11729.1 SH3 domain-containing protein [Chloroflexota bacterium]